MLILLLSVWKVSKRPSDGLVVIYDFVNWCFGKEISLQGKQGLNRRYIK